VNIYESSSVGDNSSYSCGLTKRGASIVFRETHTEKHVKAINVILQQAEGKEVF
jgi:hypothetical protein